MGILEYNYLTKFCTVTLWSNVCLYFKNHNNDIANRAIFVKNNVNGNGGYTIFNFTDYPLNHAGIYLGIGSTYDSYTIYIIFHSGNNLFPMKVISNRDTFPCSTNGFVLTVYNNNPDGGNFIII